MRVLFHFGVAYREDLSDQYFLTPRSIDSRQTRPPLLQEIACRKANTSI